MIKSEGRGGLREVGVLINYDLMNKDGFEITYRERK